MKSFCIFAELDRTAYCTNCIGAGFIFSVEHLEDQYEVRAAVDSLHETVHDRKLLQLHLPTVQIEDNAVE